MSAFISIRRTASQCLLAAVCATSLTGIGFGQETPPSLSPPRVPIGEAVQIVAPKTSIEVIERTTKVIEFKEWLTQVDGFDPKVINVIALDKNKLRVQALEQGVTTMVVTDRNKQVHTIEVFVSGDARLLQSVLNRAFPNSAIQATMLRGSAVLLRGWVTDAQQIASITELAQLYSPNVVNQIRVGGPQEVQLRVKVLEVQRSKLRQFGLNFAVLGKNAAVASTPGPITPLSALTAPIGGIPTATIAPSSANPTSMGIGITGNHFGFEGFLQALKTEGLLKIQAEPVLVTRSGEAAQLDNGGEFPIPVPQSLGTVTIAWREFGVILQALPIVISPTRLKQQVYAEVSEKDVANAITLNGTTVPGISRRRVQSTVEMDFGQTLVLGGLITTRIQSTVQKTPLLGELPVVGAAFSRKQYDHSEVELIIMITPEYVNSLSADQMPPIGPGRTTTFPTDRELYLNGLNEVPNYGPECDGLGGACDPNFSVKVHADTPWGGNTLGPQNYVPAPTTAPSSVPAPAPTQGGGLIAPPGVVPAEAVPPAPDPSVSARSKPPRTSKSIPSRYDVKMSGDSATQAGFKSVEQSSSGNRVEPASANKLAEPTPIRKPRFN
ncbi:MAG: pilus assembly protein N-terminal domain-containing protein [Planctomycetes bacterium]|nr:pilus assembly protein N-terminal domain-containing protein [Planctomycetota bacterium]